MVKTALVTGASSGIGLELARLFAADGYDLILVARDQGKLQRAADELKKMSKKTVRTLAKDLSAPGASDEVFAETQKMGVTVSVLVNNAGYGLHGRFVETDLATELKMLQVNVVALTHLTKLYVREMVKRGEGRILNVASTAAFQPGPLMAVYYASKSYVLLFSEAIANELKGTGVTVTALCPGATETEFAKRAQTEGTRLFARKVMNAETVARRGYRALMEGRSVVIPGMLNKVLAQSIRFLPRQMVTKASRMAVERV
jgi:short-subunit dehydrogenase